MRTTNPIDVITDYIENSYGDNIGQGDAIEHWKKLSTALIELKPLFQDISTNPDTEMNLPMDYEVWPNLFDPISRINELLQNTK